MKKNHTGTAKPSSRYLVPMALKNLLRYGRRTFITSLALAVGLMFYIALDSFLKGAELESERNLIRYETGTAKIMRPELWDDYDRLPIDQVIEDPERVIELLRANNIVAVPRIVFPAELIVYRDPYPEDGSLLVQVFAIDPARDNGVFPYEGTVVDGRYLKPGEDGVLLGSWLADNLGAEVGYPLTLVTRTRNGYRQTVDVEVVGIIECPNPPINRSGVFLPLDTADLYLQMDGAITELGLLPDRAGLDSPAQLDSRLDDLSLTLAGATPNLQLLKWQELAASYVAIAETKTSSTGIILLLIFIIAAVGVSNTMLMTVLERTRELGMMRSLGMPRRHIRRMLLIEAAGIGFLGALGGVILGALVNLPLVNVGVDYSSFTRELDIGYRTSIFHGTWDISTFVGAFLIGIILSVVVAFFPTRRALRLDIPASLRQ